MQTIKADGEELAALLCPAPLRAVFRPVRRAKVRMVAWARDASLDDLVLCLRLRQLLMVVLRERPVATARAAAHRDPRLRVIIVVR
jgi:hypothetical protein